jgi:hypothetical protein
LATLISSSKIQSIKSILVQDRRDPSGLDLSSIAPTAGQSLWIEYFDQKVRIVPCQQRSVTMIRAITTSLVLLVSLLRAEVAVDVEALGESLGGWKKNTVDYDLSGSQYRTHKPEITPSPDGGIFMSIRIDHRRGWLASDDHAVLEISFGPDGTVSSAQSTLAIQGRTIASDLIRTSADAGATLTGMQGAVRIGSNLVADLSSKMLREKIVEAGRVSFPSAVRHNYNLIYQAVRLLPAAPDEPGEETEPAGEDTKPAASTKKKKSESPAPPVKISPYGR